MEKAGNLNVLIFGGANGVQTLALNRESISIGRLPDQDLVLHASYVSRHHAVINRVDGGFELVDQGSTHGTWLNGLRVNRALLRPGDVIQFGSPGAPKARFESGPAQASSSLADELVTVVSQLSARSEGKRTSGLEMVQLNFLLSAARKLNAGGAKGEILQALLQVSIQLTGVERGFVFLREGGEMRLALGLRADGTLIVEDSTISRRAIERADAGASRFCVYDTRADEDAGTWDSVRLNDIRCIYCIPLRKRISAAEPSRLLGLLYLDSQLGPGNLNSIGHELLEMIATEAVTLLENALLAEAEVKARRAAEELAIAASIHAGLMAFTLPRPSFARLTATTIPCGQIGGDFYDAIALDDGLGVVVADVSGKGLPASIVAATLQGIIHAQMLTGHDLAAIADLVNRFLCARSVGKYATMVLLKLYPDGRVDYINCGQTQPLVVSESTVRRLDEVNSVVGLLADATYKAATDRIPIGARILIATDGVTEAENSAQEQFGTARFEGVACMDTLDGIIERVAQFQTGLPALDDCTLLELRYEG